MKPKPKTLFENSKIMRKILKLIKNSTRQFNFTKTFRY